MGYSTSNNVRHPLPTVSKFSSRRLFFRRFFAGLPALAAARVVAQSAPSVAPAAAPRSGKALLFFGDSLTAGYGLDEPSTESYPARLGERLKTAHPTWKIINAGLSGETTSGGLRRIDWVLRQPVDLFFLALGANDGLRGIPAAVTRSNLEEIIRKVRAKHPACVIVLAGMKMPSSMGEYATAFAEVYQALAAADKTIQLLPFLLEGVGGVPSLNQPDAIHPNAAGHQKIADHIWPTLAPLVKGTGR